MLHVNPSIRRFWSDTFDKKYHSEREGGHLFRTGLYMDAIRNNVLWLSPHFMCVFFSSWLFYDKQKTQREGSKTFKHTKNVHITGKTALTDTNCASGEENKMRGYANRVVLFFEDSLGACKHVMIGLFYFWSIVNSGFGILDYPKCGWVTFNANNDLVCFRPAIKISLLSFNVI